VASEKLRGIDLRRPVYLKVYEHKAHPLPHAYLAHNVRPIRLHEIDFYVTMRCNLPCRFCSVRAGEYDHQDLPLDRCLQIIEEASTLGLEELHFLGGEPTLREDLEHMVAYASVRGIETRIITNGMTLRRDRLRRLQACGLGEVMVSIDGLHDMHTALRGCGSQGWDASWQCVDDAVALGLRVRVAATAYRENYEDMLPLMALADAHNVDRFSIFLGSPLGRGHGMMGSVLDPYSWRTLQDRVARTASDLRSAFSVIMEQGFAWKDGPEVDRSQLKGRGTGCNTLLEDFDYLIIRSDGNLYQCVFFMTEGKPIGNVWSASLEKSLQYCLERADYRPFTEPHDRCSTCHHAVECGTGCRGYAYLYTNDWLRTDPRCTKNDPRDTTPPDFFPLCPILKWNARSGRFGGSSDQALELSEA
jgi:radical SAM protein with 4Fe4S-binding SPASM domain